MAPERRTAGAAGGRALPGHRWRTVSREPDGFTLALSDGAARAYDAHPDPGTDIVIRDWSESLQWTLWEHFAACTDAPMHLWQFHGLTVAIRVRTDEGGQAHLVSWNTREVAATVAREALSHPIDASRIRDLVSTTFPGAASAVGFRAQELAAEMVRHEILLAGSSSAGQFEPWPGTFDEMSNRLYRTWRDSDSPTDAPPGLIVFAPGRKARNASSPESIDVGMMTDWMREPLSELQEDGSWVHTDQT